MTEVRFQLDAVKCVCRGTKALIANNDDKLIVAGYFKRAELQAFAWWNASAGLGGNQEATGLAWVGMAILAPVFAVTLILLALGRLGANQGTFWLLGMFLLGLLLVRTGLIVRGALTAIQRARNEPF